MTGLPNYRARAAALTACILAASLAIAGCMPRTNDGASATSGDPVVYMDRQTGCQYLSTANGNSLTPRMDATGHQICLAKP